MSLADWYVYCLVSTDGKATYVGATVDPQRRLRQHNQELVGGARATKRKDHWDFYCYCGPFEKIRALQFEWRWKHLARKASGTPLERREKALEQLLLENEDVSVLMP
jgi:structure-specific endonuclease subunit SLX1